MPWETLMVPVPVAHLTESVEQKFQRLAAIWRACGDDAYGKIVKLLMLTGCRRDEIGGLRWSELAPDRAV